ncbi:MAG: glycosyltransferase family 4 protein [Ruminococcaceae bacterium]|nr:glycosyltransferase family 4 protein [Oscillospiraceae bacterium]
MIKIVEAISDMNIGGAGRLLINRIKNSDKKNFSYTVILPKGSLLIPHLRKVGANVIQLKGCCDKSIDLKSVFLIYKIIKSLSPNVLNSHACMSARIAGKFAKVDVNLYTRHCDFTVKAIYSVPIVRMLVKNISRFLSDGIIAVSDSARRNLLLLGIDEGMIKVIINGAEGLTLLNEHQKNKIRDSLKIPIDATVVSIFARLEDYKDHKTLLRAAKALSNFKNIYFLIVGTGSLENSLKKCAEKFEIEDRVFFLGFVDDISPIMNITDINVNCSIGTETSCLALSEGMSIGVPAIASDYLGNKYMVKNNVNGLIFPQKDHVKLARIILLLSKNKDLHNKLSKNSKKRFFSELNAKRMTRETEKYYFEMLKNKRKY